MSVDCINLKPRAPSCINRSFPFINQHVYAANLLAKQTQIIMDLAVVLTIGKRQVLQLLNETIEMKD